VRRNDINEASVFAKAVSILAAEALHDNEQLGGVLMRQGWAIEEHCKDAETKRCELFRLLHPSRDKFENEGWPGDGNGNTAA
jgi:hypothetical protein